MTTSEYVILQTNEVLDLVKDSASLIDEDLLESDEYFALMVCTDYQSYLRNYKEYKNLINKNILTGTYDIGIEKTSGENGYYISKSYNKRYDINRGRTIIVEVNDLTKCIVLT